MTHPLTPREKALGQIAYDGWAQGLPGCEWDNQTETQKRAWSKAADAILTALASGSGDHAPVAWRVRLLDGGWVVCGYEQTALELAAARKGATVQALYEPALLAENAALRAAKWEVKHVDTMNDMVSMGMARDDAETRATEAERKLAEAVGLLEPFAKLADEEGGYREDDRLAWGLNTADINWGDLRAARTFLSKEAEQ